MEERLEGQLLPYLNTAGAYADGLRRIREAADAAGRTRSPTAGLERVVLRVAEEPRRGLEAAAEAIRQIAVAA